MSTLSYLFRVDLVPLLNPQNLYVQTLEQSNGFSAPKYPHRCGDLGMMMASFRMLSPMTLVYNIFLTIS